MAPSPAEIPVRRSFWRGVLSGRRPAACALAGTLAIALRLALLPVAPVPTPTVHDEFSYLLGGDTFASGRVTNPPHPMWVHLETFHVNMQPTYCSKYPPAQALFLAFGQKALGNPWFGVLLSMGCMCAAICWMLQGWVSGKFALAGTALAIAGWGLSGYWANSYWGGAVAAGAGALLIGALPRLGRRISSGPALAAAAGIAVLANSRPYEGALTVISATAAFLWWMRREKRPLRSLLDLRLLGPMAAVLLPVMAAMAWYNYRTTGSAVVFPYSVNQRMYSASPHLYYLPPTPEPPVYRHEAIRRFWTGWDLDMYREARENPLNALRRSNEFMAPFFVMDPVGVGALAGILLGGAAAAFAALILVLPVLGLIGAKLAMPHYLAPAAPALWALTAVGMERLARRGPNGRLAVVAFVALGLTWYGSRVVAYARAGQPPPQGIATRPLLLERFAALGGKHLVIVRYSPRHSFHDEWVYNRASIDDSQVVWARDMGEDKNRELLHYFRNRQAWLLEPDADPLAPKPYPQK
jgi:hypothetical protein